MPQIQGGRATWEILLNDDQIGVVAQEWSAPKPTVRQLSFEEDNVIHLRYHAQEAPDAFV